ncbi:MAG: hypothetical protein HBSAPP04_13090 [Ignavibacteriaceae bacterium]|nr:MAG: hypothetical protein HBSAPP04_13090 [Ignavibacteriaceae bacterium]
MIKTVDMAALGQVGTIFVTANTAVTVPSGFVVIGILPYEDVKYHTLTPATGFQHTKNEDAAKKESDIDANLSYSHPAGILKLGRFSAVRLHSGAAELYLAKEIKQ